MRETMTPTAEEASTPVVARGHARAAGGNDAATRGSDRGELQRKVSEQQDTIYQLIREDELKESVLDMLRDGETGAKDIKHIRLMGALTTHADNARWWIWRVVRFGTLDQNIRRC